METIFNSLPLDYNPQQKEFFFAEDNLKFTSKFDSGNMYTVEKRPLESTYFFFISSDCLGIKQEYIYRTWFFFSIKNFNNDKKRLKIFINNMSNHSKLFDEGYKFVYRTEDLNYNIDEEYEENEEFSWRRYNGEIKSELIDDKTLEVEFSVDVEAQKQLFIAFCYPWSYTKNLKFLDYLENKRNLFIDSDIFYDRSLLCYTKEKRYLNIITISSIDGEDSKQKSKLLQSPCPYHNPIITCEIPKFAKVPKNDTNSVNTFNPTNNQKNENIIHSNSRGLYIDKSKPIIFITARVHPGETPGSFLMNGLLKFLTNKKDPRAAILRKAFTFKIIPMINPDGVYRGYYRFDTNSLNMNRHYTMPSFKLQPEIYAIKRIFTHFVQLGNVKFYYDLHAHASNKGLFLFGNSLDFLQQIENQMLPKLIEINSEYLQINHCNFSSKHMKSRDKGDKFSKEGTGRVNLQRISNMIFCYTVEASCFKGSSKNELEKILPIDFNLLINPHSKTSLSSHYNDKKKESSKNKKSDNSDKNQEEQKISEVNTDMNIMDEEDPDMTPYVTTINDLNNNNIDKNNDLDLKREEEIARKKTRRIESVNLLMILSKYFKIEIDKIFFKDKEILTKAITNFNTGKNFEEKNDYEKLKSINLYLNSSISSNENISKNLKTDLIDKTVNSDKSRKNKLNYIEDKSVEINSLSKLITENENDLEKNEKNEKKERKERKEKKEKDDLFFNLDEKENAQNFQIKEFAREFSHKNKSLSNFYYHSNMNNNFNIPFDRTKNKSAKHKKITLEINREEKYTASNNIIEEKRSRTLFPKSTNIEENKTNKKDINCKSKEINNHLNNKEFSTNNKDHLNTNNYINRDYSPNIYEKIENFSKIDYEAYSRIMFHEYTYYNFANSLNYTKNNCFSLCLKEEEKFYTPIAYEKMGVSLLIAILDYEKLNPFSRIGNTEFKCLEKLRSVTGKYVFNSDEKFKSSIVTEKIFKNIQNQKKVVSLNQKYVDILTGKVRILKAKEKRKKSSKINFPLKNLIMSKSPTKTSFGSNVNFDFPKRKSENKGNNSTRNHSNIFSKFSSKQEKDELNKLIFQFNIAKSLMNNNKDVDNKIINSENLFFDGRILNDNKSLSINELSSPKRNSLFNKSRLLTNKSGFFCYDIETINKRKIKTASADINESLSNFPKISYDNKDINISNVNENFSKNTGYKEPSKFERKINTNLNNNFLNHNFSDFNTISNTNTHKDYRNTNYTNENTNQTKENYHTTMQNNTNEDFSIKNATESFLMRKNLESSNKRNRSNLISPNNSRSIMLSEGKKKFSKKNLLINLENMDESKLITGEYSAKLRILKGVDKRNFLDQRFLNVKCIGLKPNFDNNKKLFHDEELKKNIKNQKCLRYRSFGVVSNKK